MAIRWRLHVPHLDQLDREAAAAQDAYVMASVRCVDVLGRLEREDAPVPRGDRLDVPNL